MNAEGVAAAYRQVASEVPGSPIFVMRLAPGSRHLEVQLLADTFGQVSVRTHLDVGLLSLHLVGTEGSWFCLRNARVLNCIDM